MSYKLQTSFHGATPMVTAYFDKDPFAEIQHYMHIFGDCIVTNCITQETMSFVRDDDYSTRISKFHYINTRHSEIL